jgi:hypothetical protein
MDCASDPVRSFGTFTADLQRLADWLAECGVKTVVMESTSVYWIPIFELLDERGFVLFEDRKGMPGQMGRDRRDAGADNRMDQPSMSAQRSILCLERI